MPLVAARRERVMPRLEFVVSLFHVGMHLVEVGLRVLHILMQSVVTLLTALDRAVNRILYILAVLLVVLPGLLIVLAKRVGVLVRVLMQLLGVQVKLPFFATFALALSEVLPCVSVADSFETSMGLLSVELTLPLTTIG